MLNSLRQINFVYKIFVMKAITRKFYNQPTLIVAQKLLGKILCRKVGNKVLKGKIVETEAYTQEDPSCHAYRGVTERSKTLYEAPGTVYVYFTYGMHYCMNIVTEKKGRGCAVLIRAVEPLQETKFGTNGPAKLCKAFSITKEQNGIDCTSDESEIWVEDNGDIEKANIVQTVRVGIKLAADYPWRFYIKDNKWVSKK